MSEYLAAAGAIILAVLGAIVAIDAFSGKKRWIWFGAFIGVGLVTLIFAFQSIWENTKDIR